MPTLLTTEPVQLGPLALPGDLVVPDHARGLVMFVQASGRRGAHSRWLAGALHRHHLATLLFDLLTEEELKGRGTVGNAEGLGQRVAQAIQWVGHHPDLAGLRLGLLGAGTGAAAALLAAAGQPARVGAVVLRGGRPDLALDSLARVQAPTLMIVGGLDTDGLALNRRAWRQLRAPKRLEVVPGAGRHFEEPGALRSVAVFAADWFERHLDAGWPA